MDDNIPSIAFSDEAIAKIKASLQLPENEVEEIPSLADADIPSLNVPNSTVGRKSRLRGAARLVEDPPIIPAKLTKRNEREVNERLQAMMMGGTGILGNIRPYMEMTEDEAKAICEPLASYLVRNADVIPVANQILENYDLAAITIGVASYVARVYSNRRDEIGTERRSSSPAPIRSISAIPTLDEGAPQVRTNGRVSTANGESSRP